MNKKTINTLSFLCLTIIIMFSVFYIASNQKENQTFKSLSAMIISKQDNTITIQDKNNIIYTIKSPGSNLKVGDNITVNYTGSLDNNKSFKDIQIDSYQTITVMNEENTFPNEWQDNGPFASHYQKAYQKVKNLTLKEKIASLFLVRYPRSNGLDILKQYPFAGYLFFTQDFQNKTKEEVKNMLASLQKSSRIPLLTAVDEEGGTVVRVSSNPNLSPSPFASPSTLYNQGGLEKIKQDTIAKSQLLSSLGLNLNLAPVVDVSTEPTAYMYPRTLQKNTQITSDYAKTVIEASRGTGVSYTLKHFPGYGNNDDTHITSTIDNRNYGDIEANDFPPFISGINAGAEAVLISHNVVTSIDSVEAASLSATVHNVLRNDLNFKGIIITDDLSMSAISNIDNRAVRAILAGNDLIITSNYQTDIEDVKTAVQNGTISESLIDKLSTRIIAWKYYKNMIIDNQK